MHKQYLDLALPASYVSGGWFTASEPWIHSNRNLDTYVLIIGMKGKAHIQVGNAYYTVCPGDVLIMPPHIEHKGYQVSHEVSYLWFHFRTGAVDAKEKSTVSIPMFMPSMAHARLVQPGLQLLHIEQSKYTNALAYDYQLSLILLELSEQYQQQSLADKGEFPRKIHKIQEWIRVNAHQPMTLSQVAKEFHYNKNYLCKIFKRATGHTVQKYITLCKLEIVKQALLTGDIPVKQMTKMAGFKDGKYLMRVFRQYQGMTFSEFKNAYCRVHFNTK